jgi:hypothetical protein
MKVSFDCGFLIQCECCGSDLGGKIEERFDDGQCRRVLLVEPCDHCENNDVIDETNPGEIYPMDNETTG